MARRLVTSLMTPRDYDIILVTSRYSKSSHSETITEIGTRINYPCGSFKQISSFDLELRKKEAFGVTLPQVKIANNDTVAVRWGRVGRLKLSCARANSLRLGGRDVLSVRELTELTT